MGRELSMAEVQANLEQQVAEHREREAFHAQQEAFHREERARHAADLERMSQHLEEFKAVAARIEAVVKLPEVTVPPPAAEIDLGRRPKVSKALDRVLADWPADSPFAATEVTRELNRRFASAFRRPIDPRTVSSALRRRRDEGVIVEVREGRPFQEAVYRKQSE